MGIVRRQAESFYAYSSGARCISFCYDALFVPFFLLYNRKLSNSTATLSSPENNKIEIINSHSLETQLRYLRNIIGYAESPVAKYRLFRVLNQKIEFSALPFGAEAILPASLGPKLNTNDLIIADPKHYVLKVIIAIEPVLNGRHSLGDQMQMLCALAHSVQKLYAYE